MKKITVAVALAFLCGLAGRAQSAGPGTGPFGSGEKKFEYEGECGSPLVESMTMTLIEGTVVKVVDGDSVVVLTKDKKRRRIDLVGVDASDYDAAARRELTAMVLDREVEVLVKHEKYKSGRAAGLVHAGAKDVGHELISAGAARYKQPEPYSLSHYTACVYRIIERQAREARRGLWAGGAAN